jgi:hypothetical protein
VQAFVRAWKHARMQIASFTALGPRSEPAGWSPGAVAPSTSTRAAGLLRGGLDAWRGTPERSVGVGLTDAQVATLAPFLAQQSKLGEDVVRGDLQRVRVHVGGLAAGAGGTATTIGPNIYVSDAARATRMLSWGGRTWLAHELVHTMQWRQTGGAGATDAQRDRAFLNRYIGKFVMDEGKLTKGGLVQAFREWRKHQHEPAVTQVAKLAGIGDIIHDAHPMEREASRIAEAFRDQTS